MAQKLGPGVLKFGDVGSEQEFSSKCSKVELAPEMKDEDAVGMLDGTDFQPDGSVEGNITGTFYQDYDVSSLLVWTWQNAGKTLQFTFTPSDETGLTFTGKAQIKPVKVGGDPKKHNTADFEFKLIGGLPEMSLPTTEGEIGPEGTSETDAFLDQVAGDSPDGPLDI